MKTLKQIKEGPCSKSEPWEKGFKRRVVKTTKPEHKEKGYNWRIKGKDRPEISIKLYKSKPDFAEFKKQMKRVAGHEFGGQMKTYKQVEAIDHICEQQYQDEVISEAEYQGKTVTLNNPTRSPSGSKHKFHVYVKNSKGNVVKVTFGDPNMEIKRDDPARRKAFRARHNCADKKDKTKAGYWSCYQWRAGAKVDN